MTSYEDKGAKPDIGKYYGFDHVTFWVGNARQAATYYMTRCIPYSLLPLSFLTLTDGFRSIGYKGLETGSRDIAAHVVAQGTIRFVFVSPLNPGNKYLGDHMTYALSSYLIRVSN
jgi:4-hydroxyphenylpyruvate dioxygenase